ncbi:hypothetical protein UFOVP1236_32 [uncultured Caudovirales phage]|uniref:Uncharacterized protein n=1 Tax=uncultured Caudovirales phage TaxID=2100421 RepID=A0A6J5RFP0_9CAUD|nr:hypothetical protein UFOVP1236_32 [uncultured Caudovirales phage]
MKRPFEHSKTVLCVTTAAGAAGTSAITSTAVDTQTFEGVRFLVMIGPVVAGAVTSIKIQQSDDDGVADGYSDLLGTSQTIADDADNTHIYVDIYRPGKRYLKLVVSRATQNATIGGVIAELYAHDTLPVTQVATGETFISPAEGTA